MTCRICGHEGYVEYECPVCWCDYCEDHYKEYVLGEKGGGEHIVVNGICQLCGDEL